MRFSCPWRCDLEKTKSVCEKSKKVAQPSLSVVACVSPRQGFRADLRARDISEQPSGRQRYTFKTVSSQ